MQPSQSPWVLTGALDTFSLHPDIRPQWVSLVFTRKTPLGRRGLAFPSPRSPRRFCGTHPTALAQATLTEPRLPDFQGGSKFPRSGQRTSGGSSFFGGGATRQAWPRLSALAIPQSPWPIGAPLLSRHGKLCSNQRVPSSLGQQRPRDTEWAEPLRTGTDLGVRARK